MHSASLQSTGEIAILSYQRDKAVSFLPGLIIQEDIPFSIPEALTLLRAPHAVKRLIGFQATLASVHHIMFLYISLAAFLTVIRIGNEDFVVGPKGIPVVFISATPSTINQSQWTGTLQEPEAYAMTYCWRGMYREMSWA